MIPSLQGLLDLFMSKGSFDNQKKRASSKGKQYESDFLKHELASLYRNLKHLRKAISKLDIQHIRFVSTKENKIKKLEVSDGRSEELRTLRILDASNATAFTVGQYKNETILDEDEIKRKKRPICEEANFREIREADHSKLLLLRYQNRMKNYLRQLNKNLIHEEIIIPLEVSSRVPQFWDFEAIRSCPKEYL